MKMKMKMKMKNSEDNWSLDALFEAWHSLTPEEREALEKWVNTIQLPKRTLKSKDA